MTTTTKKKAPSAIKSGETRVALTLYIKRSIVKRNGGIDELRRYFYKQVGQVPERLNRDNKKGGANGGAK